MGHQYDGAPSPAAPRIAPSPSAPETYAAFLSYSHRNRAAARGVHRGLHRVGRRFGQLHALRVFRDSTDLTASPDVWDKVVAAMDNSRHLVLVLSPAAAASTWVNREVDYWLERQGPDRLLLVLAEGSLVWDEHAMCFDAAQSTAAPAGLTRARCASGAAILR